jgi:hypothetical protein
LVQNKKDGSLEFVYEKSVGFIVHHHHDDSDTKETTPSTQQHAFEPIPTAQALKKDLHHLFALPSPAREALLSVLCQFLSNKGTLRSASNEALFVAPQQQQQQGPPISLFLHWQVMLRLLLRTAPYIDEYEAEPIPRDSSSRVSTIQNPTVHFIRDARRLFYSPEKGYYGTFNLEYGPNRCFVPFSYSCLLPWRNSTLPFSSPEFYMAVLPEWLDAWANIDRCPEYIFLWLALFCQARKYLTTATSTTPQNKNDRMGDEDWSKAWCWIRRRLLTLSQYWCLLPIGGTLPDKAWTQAPHPRSRACPARLKAFATAGFFV